MDQQPLTPSQAFKHIFAIEKLLARFVDIGNYVWSLEAELEPCISNLVAFCGDTNIYKCMN